MSALNASTLVAFDPTADNNGAGGLSLSRINVTVGPDGVAVKLVDRVPVGQLLLFATAGTVERLGDYVETIRESLSPISGVDYVDTPNLEEITFLIAVDGDGNQFTPALTPTLGGKRQKLDKPAWGIVKRGEYTQPWTLLKYKPSLLSEDSTLLVNYGSVAAFKSKNMATLDMEPLPVQDIQDQEVYRITSKMVVTEDGPFEYPPGWPTSGDYPGDLTPKPDPGSGVVPLRVHEICTINQNGYITVRSYPIRREVPYVTTPGYNPVKSITAGSVLTSTTYPYTNRANQVYTARQGQPL